MLKISRDPQKKVEEDYQRFQKRMMDRIRRDSNMQSSEQAILAGDETARRIAFNELSDQEGEGLLRRRLVVCRWGNGGKECSSTLSEGNRCISKKVVRTWDASDSIVQLSATPAAEMQLLDIAVAEADFWARRAHRRMC
jgi:hypothetical protein